MKTAIHRHVELNTSSVADIAFLLLSFFLMTTVISDDKGLTLTLPEWRDKPLPHEVSARNVFNIRINSADELMIEGDRVSSTVALQELVRAFILNHGADPESSTDPASAIVSLHADRGTSYQMYVTILDEIQAAYYSIYAERAGLTVAQYRLLDINSPRDRKIIEKARTGIPMNISIADK